MTSKIPTPSESFNQTRQFFKSGQTKALAYRIESLEKLRDAIRAREPQILDALQKDLGKPRFEAIVSEIGAVLSEIQHTLHHLPDWVEHKRVSTPLMLWPARSFTEYEPRGVCLIISPWNYPFQLLLSPLVGALAAGNCVVLKPSELAPHTSQLLLELISSTFEARHVVCLEGGRELTENLLKEKFNHIFFTGSTPVGKVIMRAASEHLTPVTLELGGKSPCILDKGVPLARAINRITWGKFFNAGQTCVAPDYMCVHQDDFSTVVAHFKKTIAEFYGPHPLSSPDLARIINVQHFRRLTNLFKDGEVLTGGETDEAACKIAPTLLRATFADRTPLMNDEIFGPLLPILTYKNIEEAYEFVNERPKPLAFYLFTQDQSVQQKALESCSFGGACINDTIVHLSNPALPFGGVGASGIGAYHGFHSFETFSHKKGVLANSLNFEIELRYPPYSDDQLKWIRFLQRR